VYFVSIEIHRFQDKVVAAGEHAINSKKVDVKRAKAKPGKIFIGGLKPEITDEMLKEYFGQVNHKKKKKNLNIFSLFP
jgi:RNA recognition motif-containing protein